MRRRVFGKTFEGQVSILQILKHVSLAIQKYRWLIPGMRGNCRFQAPENLSCHCCRVRGRIVPFEAQDCTLQHIESKVIFFFASRDE